MVDEERALGKCLIFGKLDHEFALDFKWWAPQYFYSFKFDTVFFVDDRHSDPWALWFNGSSFDEVINKIAQFVAKDLFFVYIFVNELVGFVHGF